MTIKSTERLAVYVGPAATVVYLVFAVLAYIAYPTVYGPANNNWLSDLGNRNLNPDGANFYVVGCILLGILLIAFFPVMAVWRNTGSRIQRGLLGFVQIAGVAGAISVIMTAVYTEDQFSAHQFWSRLINASFAMALLVSPFALRRRGEQVWPLIVVSAIGYISIMARLFFEQAHWLEWPSVGILLLYIWVLALMTRHQLQNSPAPTRIPPKASAHSATSR